MAEPLEKTLTGSNKQSVAIKFVLTKNDIIGINVMEFFSFLSLANKQTCLSHEPSLMALAPTSLL